MNKVLIVGGPKVGKKHLLCSIYKTNGPHELELQDDTHSTLTVMSTNKVLTTKYYVAQLDYHLMSPSGTDVVQHNEVWPKYQAVVLVFDIHKRESFESVKTFAESIAALGHSYDVCICVGSNPSKHPTETSPYHSYVFDWCLDNGYEYVHFAGEAPAQQQGGTNASDIRSSETLASQQTEQSNEDEDNEDDEDNTDRFQEKVGAERVIEALECVMWPDMTSQPKKQFPSMLPFGDESEDSQSATVDTCAQNVAQDNEEPHAGLHKPQPEETVVAVSDQKQVTADDDGGEQEHEEFEKMFIKMQALKNNMQNLSHEERKEKAAQLAMQLFSMMGGEDEDSDG